MSRQITTNVFNGMVMDLSPLNTQQNSMTDCLNGTLCTLNGDELILQNDMGNGKVQTAYLPEGYIPVGTAELGGIIYVAAYNPLTGYSQIGSFPSPCELELEDTENNSFTLNFSKFLTDNKVARLSVKTEIGDTIFKTGDKFLLTGDLSNTYNYIYLENLVTKNTYEEAINRYIKYSAAIASNSSIETIKLLEEYTYEVNNQLYQLPIMHIAKSIDSTDEASKIKEARYNIYTGSTYGKLCLISELITCNSCLLSSVDGIDNGKFDSNITVTVTGEEKFAPSYFRFKVELYTTDGNKCEPFELILNLTDQFKNNFQDGKTYTISIFNILSTLNDFNTSEIYLKLLELKKLNYFNTTNKDKVWNIKYTINPVIHLDELGSIVNYPIEVILSSHIIDLSQILSGNVILNNYQYLNSLNKNSEKLLTIDLGFSVYLKSGLTVTNASLSLYFLNNGLKTTELAIPYDNGLSNVLIQKTYSELGIIENTLCYVSISITLTKDSEEEIKSFDRWLFTNSLFNSYYSLNTLDFDSITPETDLIIGAITNSPSISNSTKIESGTLWDKNIITTDNTKTLLKNTITVNNTTTFSYEFSEGLPIILNKISVINLSEDFTWKIKEILPSSLDDSIKNTLTNSEEYNNPCTLTKNSTSSTILNNNIKIYNNYTINCTYAAYTNVLTKNRTIQNFYVPALYNSNANEVLYGQANNTWNNTIQLTKIVNDSMGNSVAYWKSNINGNISSEKTSLSKLLLNNSYILGEFVRINIPQDINLNLLYILYSESAIDLFNSTTKKQSIPLWMLNSTDTSSETNYYVPIADIDDLSKCKLLLKWMLNTIYRNVGEATISYYSSDQVYTYSISDINLPIDLQLKATEYTMYVYNSTNKLSISDYKILLGDLLPNNISFILAKHPNFNININIKDILSSLSVPSIENTLSNYIQSNNSPSEDVGLIMSESTKKYISTSTVFELGKLGYRDGKTIKVLTVGIPIKEFDSTMEPIGNSAYKIGKGIGNLTLSNGILKFNGDSPKFLHVIDSNENHVLELVTFTNPLIVKS